MREKREEKKAERRRRRRVERRPTRRALLEARRLLSPMRPLFLRPPPPVATAPPRPRPRPRPRRPLGRVVLWATVRPPVPVWLFGARAIRLLSALSLPTLVLRQSVTRCRRPVSYNLSVPLEPVNLSPVPWVSVPILLGLILSFVRMAMNAPSTTCVSLVAVAAPVPPMAMSVFSPPAKNADAAK